MDSNFYPKITDFCLSFVSDAVLLSNQKTKSPVYIAPEILFNNSSYSFKSDVYAFSYIIYELLTGEKPFKHIKFDEKMFSMIKDGLRPNLSLISDSDLCSLLRKCWSDDPNERPSFDQIFNELLSFNFRLIFEIDNQDISRFFVEKSTSKN